MSSSEEYTEEEEEDDGDDDDEDEEGEEEIEEETEDDEEEEYDDDYDDEVTYDNNLEEAEEENEEQGLLRPVKIQPAGKMVTSYLTQEMTDMQFIYSLQEEVKNLTKKLNNVCKELKDKNFCLQEKEKAFCAIKREKQNLQATRNIQNKRIHELEEKLSEKDGEITEMTEAISSLKKQCKYNKNEYIQKETNYNDEIKQNKRVLEEQERKIKWLQEYDKIYPALQRENAELKSQINHSEKAKLETDARFAGADGVIKQFTEKIRPNELEKEESLLRTKNFEENLRMRDGEITELKEVINSLEKQCKHNEQEYMLTQVNYNDEIKRYKIDLEEKAKKMERLKEYDEMYPELQRELAETKSQLRHSEQAKVGTEAKLDRAEGILKQLTEKIHTTGIEKEELRLCNKQEYMQTQANYDNEIKRYKTELEDQARKLKRLEEYDEIYSALQRELAELETRLQHSDQAKLDIEAKLVRADGMIKQLEEKLRANGVEKEELLLRLSKVAGAKLTYNNPNIADLSDDKRPTKLAEEFSELYDNEWTDAFECVDIENEQEKTSYMLILLMRAYELCRLASKKHMTNIKASLCTLSLQTNNAWKRPHQEQSQQNKDVAKDSNTMRPEVVFDFDRLKDEHKQFVIELRKFVEIKLSTEFEKIAVDKISSEVSVDREKQENLYLYIKKCVNICWSMSRAEIPVAIGFPDMHDRMHLDTSIFKPYTRTGKFIDYIVWPALYLHENGPLLCKGVAQGKA